MSLARVIFLGFVCMAAGMMQLGAAVTVSDELLDAIRCVESVSRGDICAIGDNGASIGPYQIMLDYFSDSVSYSASPLRTSNIGNNSLRVIKPVCTTMIRWLYSYIAIIYSYT